MNQGNAWILHRIGIHIHRLPAIGDELSIYTWHKGEKGFRAYRDFEVLCGMEKLVSATSLWIFIDLARKKILRVPENVSECYTVEQSHALDLDIDTWKPDLNFDPEQVRVITTRPSDYDPLGHVNNALYFDCLEILTDQAFQGKKKIQSIIMQFTKEIPKEVAEVEIGMHYESGRYAFKLFSHGCVHAAGELKFFPGTDTEKS